MLAAASGHPSSGRRFALQRAGWVFGAGLRKKTAITWGGGAGGAHCRGEAQKFKRSLSKEDVGENIHAGEMGERESEQICWEWREKRTECQQSKD